MEGPVGLVSSNNRPEERRSKRQRISLACNSCRVRKTKCDGGQPACGLCIDMDLTCGYVRRKRRSQFAENDQRLENRLQDIEQTLRLLVGQRDHPQPMTSSQMNANLSPSQDAPLAGPNASTPWTQATTVSSHETEMIVTPQHESTGNDTVDSMVVITFADESANAHFGPSSNSALFEQIRGALTEIWQSNALNGNNLGPHMKDSSLISRPVSPMRQSRLIHNPNKRSEDHLLLPAKDYISAALDSFFSNGLGVVFPYLYKRALTDPLAALETGGLREVRRSWLCLLNTIMAFSSEAVALTWKGAPPSDAATFVNRALHLLPDIAFQPADLESLQALMLLLQLLQATQHSSTTWAVKGLVVHAAYQIGLHSASKNSTYPPLEREIRTRCWHMASILDKTCSMTYGRPQAVQVDPPEMALPREVELASLDEEDPSSPGDHEVGSGSTGSMVAIVFTQTIKLYSILRMILDEIYDNNMQNDDQTSSLNVYHNIMLIESKLAAWRASVPPQLQTMFPSPMSSGDTGTSFENDGEDQGLGVGLALRFLHVRILLHRQMISCFLRHEQRSTAARASGGGNSNSNSNHSNSEWHFLVEFGRSSVEVCLRSAMHIIDVLKSQFTENGRLRTLTTTWFQIYNAFSSSLIIFATLVVTVKHGIEILHFHADDYINHIAYASETIQKLGNNSTMATRCQKYLGKLHSIASAIKGDGTNANAVMEPIPPDHRMVFFDALESACQMPWDGDLDFTWDENNLFAML